MKLKPLTTIFIEEIEFTPKEDYYLMGVKDNYMILRQPVKEAPTQFHVLAIPFDNFVFFEHILDD